MIRSNQFRARWVRWSGAAAVGFSLSLAAPHAAAASDDPQRVGFGQAMQIDAGERVDTVVTIGGDLSVLGEVEDDAVVIGGTLELGPGAVVGGDAVAIGGRIIAPETATIGGERVEVSGAFEHELLTSETEAGLLASSITTLIQILASFLLSALVLACAPRRVRSVADHMRTQPVRALLFGLALLLLFVPLLGALTISVVGIPLIPVAFMLLALVMVFGMTALGLRLGYAMPFYSEQRSAMGALAIGYLIIALVGLIPWVGALLLPLAALLASGAVLASWFGGRAALPSS